MARPEKVRLGEILVQQKLLSEEQLGLALAGPEAHRAQARPRVRRKRLRHRRADFGRAGAPARHPLHQPQVLQHQPRRGAPAAGNARRAASARWCWKTGAARCWSACPTRPTCSRTTRSRACSSRTSSWRWSTRPRCWPRSTASTAAPTRSPTSRASWSRTWATASSTSARWPPTRAWKKRRSSSCCSRCSTTPPRCAPPTSTSSRRKSRLQIRFRIDGVLHLQTEADIKIATPLALRLKLMSDLDISEKRLPQDGRFAIKVKQPAHRRAYFDHADPVRRIGGHASAEPGRHHAAPGRDRHAAASWSSASAPSSQRPNGLVLVTGPTGSGKTTTLYSALAELNSLEKKLITVEDPVEYRLPGINQVQVNEKIELVVRARAALGAAPGPGHRAGGRDARPGNRPDRPARRDDRPPGALHAAHQRRGQHAAAPDGHGRAALHGGQLAAGGAGAAPGARDLRKLHRRRTSRRRPSANGCAASCSEHRRQAPASSTARAARTATAWATAAAPASTSCWR